MWIQAINTWAFDWMGFMDSVTFTWPQKLLEMVEVWEDPDINGDVGVIPQQHKHSSICSTQRKLFLLLCVHVALGVWSTLLLRQLSCRNNKIHWEKDILYLWCRRIVGLGSKILACGHHDVNCPEFHSVVFNGNLGWCFLPLHYSYPESTGADGSRCLWPTQTHLQVTLPSMSWVCRGLPMYWEVFVDGQEISWNSKNSWNSKWSSWKSGLPLPAFLKKPTFYFLLHSLHSSFRYKLF